MTPLHKINPSDARRGDLLLLVDSRGSRGHSRGPQAAVLAVHEHGHDWEIVTRRGRWFVSKLDSSRALYRVIA